MEELNAPVEPDPTGPYAPSTSRTTTTDEKLEENPFILPREPIVGRRRRSLMPKLVAGLEKFRQYAEDKHLPQPTTIVRASQVQDEIKRYRYRVEHGTYPPSNPDLDNTQLPQTPKPSQDHPQSGCEDVETGLKELDLCLEKLELELTYKNQMEFIPSVKGASAAAAKLRLALKARRLVKESMKPEEPVIGDARTEEPLVDQKDQSPGKDDKPEVLKEYPFKPSSSGVLHNISKPGDLPTAPIARRLYEYQDPHKIKLRPELNLLGKLQLEAAFQPRIGAAGARTRDRLLLKAKRMFAELDTKDITTSELEEIVVTTVGVAMVPTPAQEAVRQLYSDKYLQELLTAHDEFALEQRSKAMSIFEKAMYALKRTYTGRTLRWLLNR